MCCPFYWGRTFILGQWRQQGSFALRTGFVPPCWVYYSTSWEEAFCHFVVMRSALKRSSWNSIQYGALTTLVFLGQDTHLFPEEVNGTSSRSHLGWSFHHCLVHICHFGAKFGLWDLNKRNWESVRVSSHSSLSVGQSPFLSKVSGRSLVSGIGSQSIWVVFLQTLMWWLYSGDTVCFIFKSHLGASSLAPTLYSSS